MSAEQASYDAVTIGPGEFRVPGLTVERLRRALRLLTAADTMQGEIADERREQLLQAMLVAEVDPVPYATLRQAERLARHREQLLATGAHTIASLGALRGDAAESATRTWLTRRRKAHELFTVTSRQATLVPAFQLDAAGEPVAALEPVLRTLDQAGLTGWELWTWLATPTSWLSGKVPATLLASAPDRVVTAAERFASNIDPMTA